VSEKEGAVVLLAGVENVVYRLLTMQISDGVEGLVQKSATNVKRCSITLKDAQ
jgi:hypothetical protein